MYPNLHARATRRWPDPHKVDKAFFSKTGQRIRVRDPLPGEIETTTGAFGGLGYWRLVNGRVIAVAVGEGADLWVFRRYVEKGVDEFALNHDAREYSETLARNWPGVLADQGGDVDAAREECVRQMTYALRNPGGVLAFARLDEGERGTRP